MVRKLIDDPQVDPNFRGGQCPPFIHACSIGNEEIIKLFLYSKRTIDYNCVNRQGNSGIHFASKRANIIPLLLEDSRIDVNALDHEGDSVLGFACDAAMKPILACPRLIITPYHAEGLLGLAKRYQQQEFIEMFEIYLKDPAAAREQFAQELGHPQYAAGELFATVVLLCDEYLKLRE